MADQSQILPSKEAALFKSILQFHEHRQYKKGLKVCEQILKKCPAHAETLTMKGMFMHYLEKKEEGYAVAREGIKHNFKSHVCWHVLGLMYRNDKNYEEAIKCYKTSLRFDPENGAVLRDLAVLQIQTGSYQGHLETRLAILKSNPKVRSSWLTVAVAHHLVGNYAEAIKTVDEYLENLSEATGTLKTTILDTENGQAHLYRAMIQEEAGEYEACYQHLNMLDFRSGDVLDYRTRLARMALKTGRTEAASRLYSQLLNIVPDNVEFLQGLELCAGLNLEDPAAVAAFMKAMKEKYPHSGLVKKRYLKYLASEDFESALRDYCLPLLKKGAPSTFHSLKELYSKAGFVEIIERTIQSLLGIFKNQEDNKAVFWCLCYLALHHIHLGQGSVALKYLDEAYSLDSTTPDLFLYYAKVLKRAGELKMAWQVTEFARKMDLGDRYLNSKSVKYLLRAGERARAQKVMALFLKEGTLEKQMADLAEIQCTWFDLESGKCLLRSGDYSGALVYFDRVCKHYDEYVDDQLDFHNYAVRKMNLVQYLLTLRYENRLYAEDTYFEAANNAVKCQLATGGDLAEALTKLNIKDSATSVDRLLWNMKKYHPKKQDTWLRSFDDNISKKDLLAAAQDLEKASDLGADVSEQRKLLATDTEASDAIISILGKLAVPSDACDSKNFLFELERALLPSSPFLSTLLAPEPDAHISA